MQPDIGLGLQHVDVFDHVQAEVSEVIGEILFLGAHSAQGDQLPEGGVDPLVVPHPPLIVVRVVVLDEVASKEFLGESLVENTGGDVLLKVGMDVLVEPAVGEAGTGIGLGGHDEHVREPEGLQGLPVPVRRLPGHPVADAGHLFELLLAVRVRLFHEHLPELVRIPPGQDARNLCTDDQGPEKVAVGFRARLGEFLLEPLLQSLETDPKDRGVVRDEVSCRGARISIPEGIHLLEPVDVLLFHPVVCPGLAPGKRPGKGGVELPPHDELSLEHVQGQVLLHDLFEEQGPSDLAGCLPEGVLQGHHICIHEKGCLEGGQEGNDLGDDAPGVFGVDNVPWLPGGKGHDLVPEVVSLVKGEVLFPEPCDPGREFLRG